jgi:hypothetical protein
MTSLVDCETNPGQQQANMPMLLHVILVRLPKKTLMMISRIHEKDKVMEQVEEVEEEEEEEKEEEETVTVIAANGVIVRRTAI